MCSLFRGFTVYHRVNELSAAIQWNLLVGIYEWRPSHRFLGDKLCDDTLHCILSVHGFRDDSTNLSVAEGEAQRVIAITLDAKGSSLLDPSPILIFGFQITCLGNSSGGGVRVPGKSWIHIARTFIFLSVVWFLQLQTQYTEMLQVTSLALW